MNRTEDRLLCSIERPRKLTRIEVSAKAVNNDDAIIRVIAQTDAIERPALIKKLYQTVTMAAYLRIMSRYYNDHK